MVKQFNTQFRIGQGGLLEASSDVTIPLGNRPRLVLVDASAGPVTITLFEAEGLGGKKIGFKKTDSSANAVIIEPAGTNTIDGAGSVQITDQNGFLDMSSDGENWQVATNTGVVTVSVFEEASVAVT